MKKITSILVSFLFFSCWAAAQKQKNDWVEMKLKAKVKSIRETQYKAIEKNGEAFKGVKIDSSTVYIFSNSGRLIEKKGGRWGIKNTYKYDGKGYRIEDKEEYTRDKFEGKATYKYDSEGYMIEKNVEGVYGSHLQGIYKYDRRGNIIASPYIYNTKFDRKGNMIECYLSSMSCASDDHCFYKYDGQGNIIEENIYNAEDESFSHNVTCKYDSKGNKIEENRDDVQYIYKYDDNGNMLEFYSSNGDYKYSYIYDSNGNMIKKVEYNRRADSGKSTYKFDYDENSNWIKRIEFENGVLISITERVIEYFE